MPRRKIHESGGCNQRPSGSWRCSIRLGGQRLLATFAIDPDDPMLLPRAASAWLDAARRRKVNGDVADVPVPAAAATSRATVGSLMAAAVAAAEQSRAILLAAGKAERGALSAAAMTMAAGGWLEAQANAPEVKTVLRLQPRFVPVPALLALLQLRGSTRLDAAKRLVKARASAQTVRLLAYELAAAAPELPELPRGWQRRVGTWRRPDDKPLLTIAQLAQLEAAAVSEMHKGDAAVAAHAARFGALPKRSDKAAVRRDAAAAAGVVALLSTGLREGELLGLRWADVSMRAKTLTVQRQRRKVAGAWVESGTKTKAGQGRVVGLSDVALDAIRTLAAIVGGDPAPDSIVMTLPVRRRMAALNSLNEPQSISIAALRGALDRVAAAAGLPRQTLHSLRKHWATRLAWQGVPEAVLQRAGGWDDVATLRKIYVQVSASDPAVLDVIRNAGNRSLK